MSEKKSTESEKSSTKKATKVDGTKSGSAKEKAPVKKLTAEQKAAADAAIISKKSSDELKLRASQAKKRAQEKILDKSYVSDPPQDPLERLANTFDNSARRWEMVVYPSLFAFVLLAGYGFFLIYRLTHDIAVLSQSVTHMAVIVSDVMPRMSNDLTKMTGSVDDMNGNIAGMSGDIGGMTNEIGSMATQMNTLTPMSQNIQSMTHNLGSMNRSVYGMQRDIGGMNRTVSSGPFGMMNDFMPFSSKSNVPRPVAPSPVWPSYNPVPNKSYKQALNKRPNTMRSGPSSLVKKNSKPAVNTTARPLKNAKFVSNPKKIVTKNLAHSNPPKKVTMPGASPVSLKK